MRVYWRKVKRGENLILSDENDGHEEELGGFRDTKRGIDALAKTFSYDPSRSRKGVPIYRRSQGFRGVLQTLGAIRYPGRYCRPWG